MARASAPGKVILLGEHAVVFGEPAIAVAVELRTTIEVAARPQGTGPSGTVVVNGEPMGPGASQRMPHITCALELTGASGFPLDVRIHSALPSRAGLGSSAALSVALLAALRRHQGDAPTPAELARQAFEVELDVQQGRASPTDTSTSAAGGAVLVDRVAGPGLLWDFERPGKRWYLHRVDAPPGLTLVIGPTGERAGTGAMVAQVAEFVARDPEGPGLVKELGDLARQGADALAAGDLAQLGSLMDRAQEGLRRLGVSNERLERFIEAARPLSLGAKLTGAGGGGSMIALTERPDEVAEALRAAGCEAPLVARIAPQGVEVGP